MCHPYDVISHMTSKSDQMDLIQHWCCILATAIVCLRTTLPPHPLSTIEYRGSDVTSDHT